MAQPKTQKLESDYTKDLVYVDGVKGKALDLTGADDTKFGLKFNVGALEQETYTVSFWAKAKGSIAWASPVLFLGNSDQWLSFAGLSGTNVVTLWSSPQGTSENTPASFTYTPGTWTQYSVSVDGNTVCVYQDGKLKQTHMKVGEKLTQGVPGADVYIGINYWDALFDAVIDSVKVYDSALSADHVLALYRKETDSVIQEDMNALDFDAIKGKNTDAEHISSDLSLPVEGKGGSKIAWTTNMPEVILENGVVTPDKEEAKNVTLTASIHQDQEVLTKKFVLTVPADVNAAPQEPMHILQVGDSNTEYGRITQGLYKILQRENGEYGQGFLTMCKDCIDAYKDGSGDSPNVTIGDYIGNWEFKDLWAGETTIVDSLFGIYMQSNAPGDHVEITFTGSAADIYYENFAGAGSFSVTIDGVDKGIVDTGEGGKNQGITKKAVYGGLGYGKHTMVIRNESGVLKFYGIDYRIDGAKNRSNISRWARGGIQARQYASIMQEEIFTSGLKELNPDKVVVLIGTNDNGANISPKEVEGYIDTMVKRITSSLPKAEVWVVSTFETVNNRARLHEYWDSVFPNVAKNNRVHYWSMGEWYGSYNSNYMTDGWHSNVPGSNQIAEKLYEVILSGADMVGRKVKNAEPNQTVHAATGTAFEALNLPSKVPVRLDDMQNSRTYMKVEWKKDGFHAEQEGSYTIKGKLLDDDVARLYNPGQKEAEITVELSDRWENTLYDKLLAEFTFDEIESGFGSKEAVASVKGGGSPVLVEDAISGKALKMDGTGSVYLDVMKADNTALLKGKEEITLSYYCRSYGNSGNWALFLSPDYNVPVIGYENYLAVMDSYQNVSVERFHNSGTRPVSLLGPTTSEWKHVVLVIEENKTILYVNGTSVQLENNYKLSDILGSEGGVFQIGKANWPNEYFNGIIDQFQIYDGALSEDEVKAITNPVKEAEKSTTPVDPGDKEEPSKPGDKDEPSKPGDKEDPSIPGDSTIKMGSENVKLLKKSLIYNGKQQKPGITVKDNSGKTVQSANYKAVYKNNKNVGEGSVTITFLGKYTGIVKKTFKIVPKGTAIVKLKARKKGFSVKWKKQKTQTSGYEIQYTTNKKFKGAKTLKNIKPGKTSGNISKLKAGKKYYVRIRTYKMVKGKKYASGWSKKKTVTTKK